jgi:sialidase-1
MEPEVLELSDGRLLMHMRTQLGHVAVSESADRGETWSEARAWDVRAPEAPATLRRIPSTGDLLLIWNDSFRSGADPRGKRTPLTAAISNDEGRTWTYRHDLETNPHQTFAYTSVAFDQGRVLLTYYVRDEATGRISSRFRSVPIAWLYEGGLAR